MRIISGKYKSIYIPNNKSIKARPTTSTAKEALFNILENRVLISKLDILDLFSGTGSIAYEFISRGAQSVVCVDRQINSVKFINLNAKKLSMNIKTVKANAWKFIEKTEEDSFDLIFADPPYNLENLNQIPHLIFEKKILKKNGWLIMEHGKDVNFEETTNFIERRTYSSVNFSFFKLDGEK
jgi:16S rRNA (guanine(966)-N(2))-methyltransferase RsmD